MQIRKQGWSGLLSLVLVAGAVLSCLAVYMQRIRNQTEAQCRVSYVYDGDTVEMSCGADVFRARLLGFDTPETRHARCDAEAAHGAKATQRLRVLVREAETVSMTARGEDRYGRRLVRLRLDGRDVGRQMISEGLAVAYSGGARSDWCARLAG